jgi:hypothetical protein
MYYGKTTERLQKEYDDLEIKVNSLSRVHYWFLYFFDALSWDNSWRVLYCN